MVFIDGQRSEDEFGQVRMMRPEPSDELVHFIGPTGTAAEDQYLPRIFQRIYDPGEEDIRIRFFAAPGRIFRIGLMPQMFTTDARQNLLWKRPHGHGAENPRLMMIDDDEATPVERRDRETGRGGFGSEVGYHKS